MLVDYTVDLEWNHSGEFEDYVINQGLLKDLIYPVLSPFQRSTDSNGMIKFLIRPWLISLWID